MNKSVEMALRLFSPRGALTGVERGTAGPIGREEMLGALQMAARGRQLGFHCLMATHMLDEKSVAALVEHFTVRLGSAAAPYTMALLLRRPMPEQMERLINAHPHYDAERRRAAVLMERAKRAHRAGNELEYRRLKDERDEVLAAARERCGGEIVKTGRCPKCQGTGVRVRAGDVCPMCQGTGRVVPHRPMIAGAMGEEVCQRIEREVDEVLTQASEIASEVARQVREMGAA